MRSIALTASLIALMNYGSAKADDTNTPGFATCAAYYFLAARGHGVQDYDRLYTAGELSLNEAVKRHGKDAADAKMGEVSGIMMKEMHQDWREVEILDKKYGAPCEALLRDAGDDVR